MPCGKSLLCYHQSLGDVPVHFSIRTHKANVKLWNKQTTPSFSNNQDISFQNKVNKSEVMVSNSIMHYNLPLAAADHLRSLFKSIFTDSKYYRQYLL